MIRRFERFFAVLSDINRAWHKIASEEMSRHGLKGSHAVYMTMMERHPGGITCGELCEYCGRDKAEVSRMTAILIEKGMVKKEGDKIYRSKFYLTDLGMKTAAEVIAKAEQAVIKANYNIDPSDRETFYRVLESISLNLISMSENGL